MAKTYDLTQVLFAVDGSAVSGFQDGDAVTVVFDNDFFNKVVGSDGEVARAARNDRTGKITFNLLYTSELNATFSAILARQRTLTDKVGISIYDNQGGCIIEAPECWILKAPDLTFGAEVGTVEWTFDTGQMSWEVAGISSEAG